MNYYFTLVNEKRDKLKYFKGTYISVAILLYLFVITIFIAIFNKYIGNLTIYLFIIPTALLFFLQFLSKYKYNIIKEYDEVGELIFEESFVMIRKNDKEIKIDLSGKKIKFEYNHIRGKNSKPRGNVHSGINELILNGEHYTFLIVNDRQLKFIKAILKIWYKNGFCLAEFSRDQYHHRLIELNDRFDWKKLNEIKENCN